MPLEAASLGPGIRRTFGLASLPHSSSGSDCIRGDSPLRPTSAIRASGLFRAYLTVEAEMGLLYIWSGEPLLRGQLNDTSVLPQPPKFFSASIPRADAVLETILTPISLQATASGDSPAAEHLLSFVGEKARAHSRTIHLRDVTFEPRSVCADFAFEGDNLSRFNDWRNRQGRTTLLYNREYVGLRTIAALSKRE